MKIVRLLTALGLVLSLAGSTTAQSAAKDGQLALLYDVDATALTYCVAEGANGPFGDPKFVTPKILTSGSSTTVTEAVTGSNPFASVVVGDVLVIRTPTATAPNATTNVAVTEKASSASITVDTAIDLAISGGHNFGYYHHVCGTSTAFGWFAIPTAAQAVGLTVLFEQGDIVELATRWECKDSGAGAEPFILYPDGDATCGGLGFSLSVDRCVSGTPGSRLKIVDSAPAHAFCRVGVAYVTTDESDDGTSREKVTIKVTIR